MNVEGRNSSKSANWPWILLSSFSKHCKWSYCLLGLDQNICLSWCSQNRCMIVNFLVAFAISSSSSSDHVNNPDLCFFVCGWVFAVSIKSLLALLVWSHSSCNYPCNLWDTCSSWESIFLQVLDFWVWQQLTWYRVSGVISWLTSTLLSDPGVEFSFPLFILNLGGKVIVFK